jgi:predicted nucleotidyltransferase
MQLQDIKDKIVYEVIAGSHAYGTNIPTSDKDTRGIFLPSKEDHISFIDIPEQANDTKSDIVFYSLKRFFNLVNTANPNIIELLWIPESCIINKNPVLDPLFENRKIFITRKAYMSHFCYAEAQIKKAKGANKRVNNPKSEIKPVREDFCFYINVEKYNEDVLNSRPIPIKDTKVDLNKCHCAKLEHSHNFYRLYDYSDVESCKGVFQNNALVCQSIPFDDETKRLIGFLIYDEESYVRELNEWKQYWEWKKNRNEARWVSQEKGELDYDQKNIMHCYRLLLSSKNILQYHEPIVRFEGDTLKYLMSIRNGDVPYDEIMSKVDILNKEIKELYEKSTLPAEVDLKKSEKIYKAIYGV